ncbi:MAG TPA: NEAT domain-containing protein [Firmicutes bacterium]|mgnify:CR=1 FL=1|nr:NEAT domain-containing protein [Bacillota bacterium]
MVHTDLKKVQILCSLLLVLVFFIGLLSVPVFAASSGIYLATATPHYKHPTTGTIEDSGGENSSVLGQSMTDSATHKQALVEVDANGNTYITVRLKLMDNIQNPQFQVDGNRSGSFTPVTATAMQEDLSNNTTDYRMKVPGENAIIRCNMYVVPMGREVIFYITVSNLQSGSGDFVTSIKVAQEPASGSKEPAAASSQKPVASSAKPAQSQAPVSSTASSEASTASEATSSQESSTISEVSSAAAGLEEFDASGNEVSTSSQITSSNSGVTGVLWWVLGAVVVIVVAGGCIWYFCFFKKGRTIASLFKKK